MQTQSTPSAQKRATAGFAISLVAGIIILINALVFFALSSLIASFASFIPAIPGMPLVAEAAIATINLLGAVGLIFA